MDIRIRLVVEDLNGDELVTMTSNIDSADFSCLQMAARGTGLLALRMAEELCNDEDELSAMLCKLQGDDSASCSSHATTPALLN